MKNRVKSLRLARGWSQDELARRSVVSRSGISAIEIDRLVPSAEAALAIARALGCRFEEVFYFEGGEPADMVWAAVPAKTPCRYWLANVAGRRIVYSSAALGDHVLPHDGIFDGVHLKPTKSPESEDEEARTLVIASCDPAIGLLASELARVRRIRLLVLSLSSRAALAALGKGLIHVAGVHFAGAGKAGNNAQVRSQLGLDYQLLRAAEWQAGLAFDPQRRLSSVRGALQTKLRWVGRETGSAARQCLDEVLGDRQPPRHLAQSHRGVAEAIRAGFADAGVCVQLVSEQAGLNFLRIRKEPYDLCFAIAEMHDPRIQALVEVVQSSTYRRMLAELPGYTSAEAGALRSVE
ncbi:MAG TPA: substrate-binding domain-containing protein [Pirellulales bacterium]|jgi:molybdate-binding protein/DNA-binding XRE family transcriptional regulator